MPRAAFRCDTIGGGAGQFGVQSLQIGLRQRTRRRSFTVRARFGLQRNNVVRVGVRDQIGFRFLQPLAQFGKAANWPLGAALSVTTMVLVSLVAASVVLALKFAVRRIR